MTIWKSFLNTDPTEWLLEENNPSVRYFTLRNIFERPEMDPEVREAKADIMKTGTVPKILAKQEDGGYWGIPDNFYLRGKYKGTSWQLIILAELGADSADERIKNTCEFMLKNSQDPESGAFSYISDDNSVGDAEKILPCLTANMVWSLIRLDYLDDERVQKALEWLIAHQRFDDEPVELPEGEHYKIWKKCWGERTCHSIIVKSLKAFSEIPENKRTPEMENCISKCAEHMLNHRIHKRSQPPAEGRFKWLEFGFPLMWNIDALEVLGLLTKLGYKDKRMQEAMDMMISKQNGEGRWTLENTFNGRFQTSIERKGEESKWITLNVLKVLKSYYG
ncbi:MULTISPECIES: prenyltransferase/squalene oxidase repeat-containing protein [Methanobacterium]|uniref:Nitrogen fixation protein NifH n=1 Tax=Methanobacterium bryantii TaxID=2161 RepID=A0A2A2H0S8_METBR|nr:MULTISPECIES: prenyltransferase/squalene oxidase repeat-containing protein [Methanobacterium]OEC88610.1 nitrogen fixation protein NifH [Methanobacterium sp. A39]PAV02992.1 nitrogen fixation protein NifH [Methanobacterium bryantii]